MAASRESKEVTYIQYNDAVKMFKVKLKVALGETKPDKKDSLTILMGPPKIQAQKLLSELDKLQEIKQPEVGFDADKFQEKLNNDIEEFRNIVHRAYVEAYVSGRTKQSGILKKTEKSILLKDLEIIIKRVTDETSAPILLKPEFARKADHIDAGIFGSIPSSGPAVETVSNYRNQIKYLFDTALEAIYTNKKQEFINCIKVLYRARGEEEWNELVKRHNPSDTEVKRERKSSDPSNPYARLQLKTAELEKSGIKFEKGMMKDCDKGGIGDYFEILRTVPALKAKLAEKFGTPRPSV